MKKLEIKNWNTADNLIKFKFSNGYSIGSTFINNVQGGYSYELYNVFDDKLITINISRIPANGRYAIRGRYRKTTQYSNIYYLSWEQIKTIQHIRYVFNEIIKQLC